MLTVITNLLYLFLYPIIRVCTPNDIFSPLRKLGQIRIIENCQANKDHQDGCSRETPSKYWMAIYRNLVNSAQARYEEDQDRLRVT
jgi:hypothetical protein